MVETTIEVPTTVMVAQTTLGLPVNPANALSRGLVSMLALSEGIGNSFLDSVTGKSYKAVPLAFTQAGSFAPKWFVPPTTPDYNWPNSCAISNLGGAALAIQGDASTANLIPPNTTGYSYAVLLQPLDTTTFGRIFDGTGMAVLTTYINMLGNPGTISTTWRDGNGKNRNPLYKFKVGQWLLILCTVQQGLGVMYVNGVEVARDTTVDIARSAANQAGQLVYNSSGKGQNTPNANFSSFWIWQGRVLTAAEAWAHYQSPWQMVV